MGNCYWGLYDPSVFFTCQVWQSLRSYNGWKRLGGGDGKSPLLVGRYIGAASVEGNLVTIQVWATMMVTSSMISLFYFCPPKSILNTHSNYFKTKDRSCHMLFSDPSISFPFHWEQKLKFPSWTIGPSISCPEHSFELISYTSFRLPLLHPHWAYLLFLEGVSDLFIPESLHEMFPLPGTVFPRYLQCQIFFLL